MPKRTDIQSILIIGAGPIVIGQACEFDYSGAQACKALREEGYRVILVNSNPATIMTDPEMADAQGVVEEERPVQHQLGEGYKSILEYNQEKSQDHPLLEGSYDGCTQLLYATLAHPRLLQILRALLLASKRLSSFQTECL